MTLSSKVAVVLRAVDPDRRGFAALGDDMLHAVFDQRLQGERRHLESPKVFGNGDLVAQALPEARRFNFEIIAHDLEFLRKRDEAGVIGAEREAEQRCEFADRIFGALWDRWE